MIFPGEVDVPWSLKMRTSLAVPCGTEGKNSPTETAIFPEKCPSREAEMTVQNDGIRPIWQNLAIVERE